MVEAVSKNGDQTFTPVSKEYLQSVFWSEAKVKGSLREGDDGVTVEDVEIEGGNGFGENYGSDMVFANVKVRTRKGLSDVGVVIKSLKKSRWHLEMMNIFVLFEKEVEFFNKTIPAIVKFQRERGVRRLLTEIVPKCLFAKSLGDEHIVITKNLRRKGFRIADRHFGLDFKHSILAMEALGRFHAASLAMKLLEPEAFWKVSKNVVKEPCFTVDRKTLYDRHSRQISRGKVESLVEAEAERGAEDADLLLRFSKVAERVIERRGQLGLDILKRYCEPLAVINHGDFWINNIMYRYEKNEQGEEIPVSVKLVDFQMVRYGSPTLDLHTFLYASTTRKLREDHEEDLLRAYHWALLAGIQDAGVVLETSYRSPEENGMPNGNERDEIGRQRYTNLPDGHPLSFRALKEDLNRHWPWGLMQADIMLPIVLWDSSEAGNIIETTMMNSTTPENEDEEEKIVGYEMLKKLPSKHSDERYLEVIREFAHKGYHNDEAISN